MREERVKQSRGLSRWSDEPTQKLREKIVI